MNASRFPGQRIARVTTIALLVAVLGISGAPAPAQAVDPDNVVAYQGRILNTNGVPVGVAAADMQFSLWDSFAGGTCLWSNDSSACASNADMSVSLTDGLFSVNLGDTGDGFAAIPDSVFADNASVYLEVIIESETLTPRKRVVAAPYAINSQTIDGLDSTELCLTTGVGCPAGAGAWESSAFGTYEDDDDVVVGTSGNETIANTGFSLGGNDLFVAGDIGVEGTYYTDGGIVTGGGITFDGAAIDLTTTAGESLLIAPAGTGNVVLNTDANSNVRILATGAATDNLLTIMNTGFGTTSSVNGIDVSFIAAAGGVGEINSMIDLTGTPSGDASDTFRALSIATIAGSASLETAISIGENWDVDLVFLDTTPAIEIADTGVLSFVDDAANTLMTLTDAGTVGTLTTSGDIVAGGDNVDSSGAPLVFNGVTADEVRVGTGTPGTATGAGDLYVTDVLEVDGAVEIGGTATAADFACTDCLDFTEFSDALALDASTSITMDGAETFVVTNSGTGNARYDLMSTGDFIIRDGGLDTFVVYGDDGTIGVESSTTSSDQIFVDADSITTGNAFHIQANGLTSGNAGRINAASAFSGNLLSLAALTGASTGDLLDLSSSAATSTARAINIDLDNGDNDNDVMVLTTDETTSSGTAVDTVKMRITASGEVLSDVGFTAGGASTEYRDGSITKTDGGTFNFNDASGAAVTLDFGGVTTDLGNTINIATNSTTGDAITIGNSSSGTTLALTGGDDWGITNGGDATFISASIDVGGVDISLESTASATTSGAFVIGTFDEFDNSTSSNVQDVLDDFDTVITGLAAGSSKWTDGGTFTYLTSTTDDLVVGDTTVAGASLFFDESTGQLDLGTDSALAGTIRLYSATAATGDPTLTADATGDLNLTPGSATALVNVLTGNLQVGNGAPGVTLDGEDAYIEGTLEVDGNTQLDGDLAVNGGDFTSSVVTFNFLDAAASSSAIDIGGVTTNLFNTINIATNGTSSDTITVGNSNASTTIALTGGDDWSMTATGVLTLSASAAQTTAIVMTDTDYTNAISIGDNAILGTTANIDLTNFDVVGSSGDITTAGDLAVNGNDITSTGSIAITPGGIGDTVLVTDGNSNAQVAALAAPGAGNDLLAISTNGFPSVSTNDAIDITFDTATNGAGTETNNALNITMTGSTDSGDVLRGINIGAITGTAATENALRIAAGWDVDIVLGDTSPIITVANTGTITFADSAGNSLMTIADAGTVGDVNVMGDIVVTGDNLDSAGAPLVLNATAADEVRVGTGTPGTATGAGDLYVTDALEVDGAVDVGGTLTATDFACTDCLDFTEFVDAMDLDASTSITLDGAENFTFSNTGTGNVVTTLNSTGDFEIQDLGSPVFTITDDRRMLFSSNITTTTAASFSLGVTSGTGVSIDANSLTTSAGALFVSSVGGGRTSGRLVEILDQNTDTGSRTVSGTMTNVDQTLINGTGGTTLSITGRTMDVNRTNGVNNATATTNVTGPVMAVSNSWGLTTGTATDSGVVLDVDQNFASATGNVLDIGNAGTGFALMITQTGNATAQTVSTSASTADVLNLTANSLSTGSFIETATSGTFSGNLIQLAATGAATGDFIEITSTSATATARAINIDLDNGNNNNDVFVLTTDETTNSGTAVDTVKARITASGEFLSDVGFTAGGASTRYRDGSIATTGVATFDFQDAAGGSTTLDFGGVTTDLGNTINIATNSTTADAITIGNNNASTTMALTGGDDWSITSVGSATFADVACTDCLDFDSLEDALDLDASTTVTQDGAEFLLFVNSGTNDTRFNLTSTGDFDIEYAGTNIFSAEDTGYIRIGSGSGTNTSEGLIIDPGNVTGVTTEQRALFAALQTIGLADGATIADQRQWQFIAPTINGVAGGGTETVTNAATVYINGASTGSDITFTNGPYALWVAGDTSRFDGALEVNANITTSGDLAVNGDDITSDGTLTLDSSGTVQIGSNDTFTTTGTVNHNLVDNEEVQIDKSISIDSNTHGMSVFYTNTSPTDGSTKSIINVVNLNDGGATGVTTNGIAITNLDTNEVLQTGVSVNSTTAGGITTGYLVSASAGTIATGLDITGTVTTAIDLTDAGIGTGLAMGVNDITGTTGDINFTNFDVTGSTGNIVTAGDLAVNGGDLTSTASLTIDPSLSLTLGTGDSFNTSGDLSFTLDGSEQFTLSHGSTQNSLVNLTSTGDFVFQDAGVTYLTLADNDQISYTTDLVGSVAVSFDGPSLTTGTLMTLDGDALTSGDLLSVASNSNTRTSSASSLIFVLDAPTYTTTATHAGSVLNTSQPITNNTAATTTSVTSTNGGYATSLSTADGGAGTATINYTGTVLNVSYNATETSGVITSSGNVLNVTAADTGATDFTGIMANFNQAITTATGAALNVDNAGTGSALVVDQNADTGTTVNDTAGGAFHITNTGNSDYGLTVYSNDAITTSDLGFFFADSTGFDTNVLSVRNDTTAATSSGLYITQNAVANAATGTVSSQALVIDTNEAGGTDEVIVIRSDADGTPDTEFSFDNSGTALADGAFTGGGADFAEFFYANDLSVAQAEVVCRDGSTANAVKRCEAGNTDVVGVISSAPAFIGNNISGAGGMINETDPHYQIVGLLGQIPTFVNADEGAIAIGDPIMSSSVFAGYGAKARGPVKVLGYALESLASGTGTIKVAVDPEWYIGDVLDTDGTAMIATDNVVVADLSSASAGTPGVDSPYLALRGSGWNGAAAEDVSMSFTTEVTDASDYRLSIRNSASAEVAYITDEGTMLLAGDLVMTGKIYPSDRGVAQTAKYIYYDGDTGPGGDMMRTNAAGWSTGSYDFAEMFPSSEVLASGEVVVFDATNEHVRRSSSSYDDAVAGIVSTRPGFLAGENREGDYPIALAGRVPTKVSSENGSIAVGDPLTTSTRAGYAMKATKAGPIVGYALEPYNGEADDQIIVYVNVSYWGGDETTPLPGTDNQASQILVSSSSPDTFTSLDMNGTIYMHANDIVDVRRIAGISDRWVIEEDGTIKTASVVKTVIESYQGEKIETVAVTAKDALVTLVGTAELQNGVAVIDLETEDTTFNDVTSTIAPVRVLVTPNGPVSLYVSEKSNDGFTVQQVGGADSGITFDWMITAYRKDMEPEEYLHPEEVPAEEPVVEEPIVDATTQTEEPVVEEPVVEEPAPEPTPTTEETVVEVPVVEEVIVEEPAPPVSPDAILTDSSLPADDGTPAEPEPVATEPDPSPSQTEV